MKYTSKQKTTHTTKSHSAHFQAAQNKGQALNPPASGIEIVDNQTVQRMSAPQPTLSSPTPENNTGLPDNLKAGIEALSGYSMADVKVHYNSSRPAQLQALAYTQGTDIHIAPGQERYLPHEAWHVVQQKQGRVQPTKQLKGKVNVNDDSALEREADLMGVKAKNLPSDNSPFPTRSLINKRIEDLGNDSTIQRLTLLAYNPVHDRPNTDVIAAMHHARTPMTFNETFLAAQYSGYASQFAAPGNCKHYVAYSMIKDAVFNAIRPPIRANLGAAVAWLNGRPMIGAGGFAALPAAGGGFYHLGAQPAPNIPQVAAGPPPTYGEAVINTEVDDFIKNLANDPRNLYYRANSSGDNGGTTLDIPQGHGARSLAYENGRLHAYRLYLQGLGLAGI